MQSSPSSPAQPMILRLLPVLVVIAALAARLIPGTRTIDDSYITYRYASNILAGNGFVYNPNERVLGTTTPLYTALMVGLGAASGGAQAPFPQIALLLNTLADGLTCWLLFNLGCRLGSPHAGLGAALAWAVAPFSVTFAIGGLETSLYVLLLVSIIYAHLSGWHIRTGLLSALALLTRPDALILLGPLYLDRAWQIIQESRRQSQKTLPTALLEYLRHTPSIQYETLALLLPSLLWLIFATFYFGSPIPHSITAKNLAYRLGAEAGLVRLLQHYTTPFLEHLTFGNRWVGVGLVVYPFFFLLGGRRALRITSRIWPFLVYPWLYLAVFAWANPLIFRWYLTPPLPAYFLILLLGLEQLILDIAAALKQRGRPPIGLPGPPPGRLLQASLISFIILAPSLLSLQEWSLHPTHGLDRPAPDMAWYQLELLYRQAAEIVTADLQTGSNSSATALPVLAAGDVGVLGFYTPTRILDLVGLNSPETTEYYPLDPACYTITYAVPPDLIIDAQPDYIVILEVYGRACLLKDTRFQATYILHHNIPTDIYGSNALLIFKRSQP